MNCQIIHKNKEIINEDDIRNGNLNTKKEVIEEAMKRTEEFMKKEIKKKPNKRKAEKKKQPKPKR